MNIKTLALCLATIVFSACARDAGPPVAITNVRILAPLPGGSTGTAYFNVENRNDTPITINGLTSPQFAKVEMHETTIVDGVSRMRPLDSVRIEGNSSAVFEPGGKHAMLHNPSAGALPGSSITLEFSLDDGLLIVSATMQNRIPSE